jgi:putative zinc ribbon protein
MADRRFPRDRRGERRGRNGAKGAPARRKPAQPERPVLLHRLYGAIPLLVEPQTDAAGRTYLSRRFDPEYAPPLPPGAVRGDIRRQVYCCDIPKYFYCDEDRSCVQCGREFVFRASEQKYWYETLQFHFSAIPVRCLGCRRQRRSEHALREQIGRARAHLREEGDNPAPHLALARALVEYHERTSRGDLDAAVAAARKAARLWPEAAEPLYWEGMAQVRADRPAKARQALSAFLEHPALRGGWFKESAQAALLELPAIKREGRPSGATPR